MQPGGHVTVTFFVLAFFLGTGILRHLPVLGLRSFPAGHDFSAGFKGLASLLGVDILTSFLPKQLGAEETKKICSDIISKLGANSIKDIGKVMGELKKTHSDEIDFAKAGPMIRNLLNK